MIIVVFALMLAACNSSSVTGTNTNAVTSANSNSNTNAVVSADSVPANVVHKFTIHARIPETAQETVNYSDLVKAEPTQAEGKNVTLGQTCRKVGYTCEYIESCCGGKNCERTCLKKICVPEYDCVVDCRPKQAC